MALSRVDYKFNTLNNHIVNTVKSAVSDLCCRRPSTVSDRFSVHRRFHMQTDLSRATICCARPATAISCTVAAFKSAVNDRDPGSGAKLYLPVRCQLQGVKMRCLASAIDWPWPVLRLRCSLDSILDLVTQATDIILQGGDALQVRTTRKFGLALKLLEQGSLDSWLNM